MKPNRLSRCLTTLACTLLSIAAFVPGCADDPAAPAFDNPFDPRNPAAADPLDLRAVYADGRVTLSWITPPGRGITGYVVHWVYLDNNYEIGRLTTVTAAMTFVVEEPVANTINEYRVQALGANGATAAISHVVPATVMVPPIVRLASGLGEVRSRHQDLIVRAAAGDYAQIDVDGGFTQPAQAEIQADSTVFFASFDLGPRPGTAPACTVFARAAFDLGGGLPPAWSLTDTLPLTINFAPTILRPDSTTTVAEPLTDLAVSHGGAGVDSMRFGTSPEDVAAAPWRPGAALATAVELLDTVQEQTVYAEFLADFGFIRSSTLALVADPLTAAEFRLVLPGNRVSLVREVPVRSEAQATEMRISQYPDFAGSAWVPYADRFEIVLEGEPGLKVIYAQFRNHWYESPILTDFVILSGASVQVAFTHPTDGLILEGGTTIDVAGVATTFDGDFPITRVQVHLGDGWQDANGGDNWEAVWDVPRLAADTTWPIGALARAENAGGVFYTGVAWINVTISQLTVAITAPAPFAEIERGTTVAIAGTATPFLAGAPLDSVVVDAAGQRLSAAPPLDDWTVDWTTPEGAGTTPVEITAWVYAGADSLSDRVQVTLVAPAPGR
ncbi:MAG TPA: fibronectin type III domain-containing protein [Candidatus Krumholzibacteria bacterium]|nr:fibronectin type III domain-containing protein [Candidatus Krumholzibacteria bacterium]HPD70590.1 fibronectin type III domain-containing protein [Candidatus Krumholzibacteria bacterium]HRY39710.1 fibronectin type III domain-containing protein [Candidatus Krumholzibacteria bacterium]